MIIPCPACRRDVESPYEQLGRKVRCPLCGQTFTVALPMVIPVGDDEAADADPADNTPTPACTESSGLSEFVRSGSHATPPADPAPTIREASLPAVGWHVLTSRGWLGPMHIVQVARAAWAGKILRTTLLHQEKPDMVIQAGNLRGIFPREEPGGELQRERDSAREVVAEALERLAAE